VLETSLNGTGRALNLDNGTLNATFNGVTSTSGANNVNLVSVSGTANLGSGALSGATNTAFNVSGGTLSATYNGNISQANNAALVSILGNHTSGTLTFQTGTLNATNGTGLQFDNADGTYNFNGTTTLGGGDAGVDILNGSGGTFNFGTGVGITNPSGIAYREDTSTANVTFGGGITKNNNANHAVDINAKTGGTTAFNGAILASTTTANAIDLTNTGGTVNFTGGLNLTTTGGVGFNATGAGATVSATQNNSTIVNTINSTTGTALNVVNTTIGASGLTFRSISANGAINGIVLNNTGSSGGLTVTGTGAAGSGGTIQNSTGTGILFSNIANLSLNRMNITGNLDDGIGGSGVNGLVVDNCSITSNGDNAATDDSGIDIINLTGSASGGSNPTSITNSTISNNFEFELQITNNTGTLTDLQMSGNTISSNGFQLNHGNLFNFLAVAGTANMTLNLTGGSFTGNTDTSGGRIVTATGVQCDHSGTGGTMTCNISNTNFTNNNVGPQASVAVNGNVVFDFNGNNIQGSRSHAINFFADANAPFTKTLMGRVRNNIIGTANVTGSGSTVGFPIRVQNEGRVPVTLAITGNIINESVGFTGINVNHGISTTAGTGATNVTITGNSVNNIDSGRGVLVQQVDHTTAGLNAGTLCADISGNTFSNIAGQAGDGTIIRVREASNNASGPLNVRQLTPTAAVNANELDDANGVTVAQISLSGAPTFGAGVCTQPSN
jgi:hypothetical protein